MEAKTSRCFLFRVLLLFFPYRQMEKPVQNVKGRGLGSRMYNVGKWQLASASHRDYRVKCYGLNVEEHTGLNGGLVYCLYVCDSFFSTAKKGVCQKEWSYVSCSF